MKQHLQTATLGVKLATAIADLQDFIAACRDAREARKALAVKLVYQDYLYEEIQTILDVSLGSIAGWKQAYEQNGIDGLRLNHKGRKSHLSSEQRQQVLSWLSTKDCWGLGELEYKLAFEYDVVYESKQSYYDLFDSAGISWKKTTKLNPKANPDAVAAKKKRLKHCIRFAPNCPKQNPIEDIWLQAKTWVRRFSALIPSFSVLKWIFEWFIRHTTFDFSTLQMYGGFSKIK